MAEGGSDEERLAAATATAMQDAAAALAAAKRAAQEGADPSSYRLEWEDLMARAETLRGAMQRFAVQLATTPPQSRLPMG